MKIIVIAIALFGSFGIQAQVEEKEPVPPPPPTKSAETIVIQGDISDFPDVEAQFPGGPQAMKMYIQQNVIYPEVSRKKGDQGRVYLSFVVELDGSISGIEIPRPLTPELDAEAIRLISEMPRWIPGQKDGKPVRSRCRLPITFTLAR